MATDFAPGFQKKFHEKVIAALLQTMEDQGNQRVQAHAAAALINFRGLSQVTAYSVFRQFGETSAFHHGS